ncbi:MAG: gluconate 2-dehydrogenase subunit 3 family protein [Cyclobacteriaceae bacterium]|nr:gluconate 2-dehydrogenase subunit 3 family protein [Cyclobacteriaceae bacterium]
MQTIDRREALRRTALVMGGMLSASTIAALLKGCKAEPALTWKPEFFTEEQARTITRLADIIIPRTDTPGAVETGVPYFIEQVVKDCFTEDEQKSFIDQLNAFISGSNEEFGSNFLKLSPEKQEAYVEAMHQKAVEGENDEGKDGKKEKKERPFILKCKELTMAGFFTSEAGATQVLQYTSVPGSFKGCISVEEAGGKAWAT